MPIKIKKTGTGQANYVFFHSGGVRYNSYLPLIKSMAKVGTVYYFNLPGHGSHIKNYEVTDYVQELTGLIDSLSLDNMIFIGHSFGGFCAYQVGQQLPSVDKLILIDPLLVKVPLSRIQLLFYVLVWKNIRGLYYHHHLYDFYVNAFKDLLANILTVKFEILNVTKLLLDAAVNQENYNNRDLNKKTVILHGKYDSVIPYEEIKKAFPENVTVVEGEHDWCMEDPEKTREIIFETFIF